VEFLCYHRDREGSTPLRAAMVEEHWSYMDRFDLIARGPTYLDDETLTGSVHVVDVPDATAARAFAFDEPCYQAGAYRDVLIRRTAWTRHRDPSGEGHLVIGFTPRPEPYAGLPALRDDLIGSGPLLSDDGTMLLGVAALAPDPDDVLPRDRFVGVEVHRWEPGGRR
jgi:uncharacterized protein YciI